MTDTKYEWPKGDSETAKLIRTKNWAETPLGPIEEWPQTLKTSVDLILPCDFPMVILWGDDLIQIYNEGYRTILADKHPAGFGQPTQECWPRVWEFNEPIYERVRAGETVTLKDQLFQIVRRGPLEDAWFTLCYSPMPDETGAVAGVLVTIFETTDRVKADAERKQAEEELQNSNKILEKRVEERTAELRSYQHQLRSLVSQLNKAEEKVRHRLAAELHANLGQMLAVAKMSLDRVEKTRLFDDIADEIIDATDLVDDAITYTRELMSELKPPPELEQEDIGEALAWLAKKMETRGLNVTIRDDEQPKPLSEEIRTTLYQCVRELLYNVIKHAGVNEARLLLSRDDEMVRVTVEDEGRGFDPEGKDWVPGEKSGFGLFNILERIDLLGGSLDIISGQGEGTKATLCVPLQKKEKEKEEKILYFNQEWSRT